MTNAYQPASDLVRWWLIAERGWPRFAESRAKAGEREIPVMVLEPRGPIGI